MRCSHMLLSIVPRVTIWPCLVSVLLTAHAATQPARQQPPVIAGLFINDTARTVSDRADVLELRIVIAGTIPTEFRVSGRADMANALWSVYVTPLKLRGWQSLVSRESCDDKNHSGAPRGRKLLLYLQARAALGGIVQVVDGQRVVVPQNIESNIVSDSICVLSG